MMPLLLLIQDDIEIKNIYLFLFSILYGQLYVFILNNILYLVAFSSFT